MKDFDVLTMGAATQDVFLRSSHFEERKDPTAPDGLDACFPMGAKIGVDAIDFATGGGATNAAVTMARFGLKTACLARVGEDVLGRELVDQLRDEWIETAHIQRDAEEKTAYSVILLSGTGHRSILTYRGASQKLDVKVIPWKSLKTKWIYLTSVGGNLEALDTIFRFTKKTSARVAWNPGNSELDHGMKTLLPFLRQTAVLDLNREEAATLTHLAPRHLHAIIERLHTLPSLALLISDGAHGAYVNADGETWFAPALKAKRVNTTGAGDALGSGFVAALAKGHDVREALQVGMLNATGVVTHMGAKAGILKRMPSLKEMKTVLIKPVHEAGFPLSRE